MNFYTVDPRTTLGSSLSCDTCCCVVANGRPGEKNLWTINYAPWSLPIGGLGLKANPIIDIELVKSVDVTHTNLDLTFNVAVSTVLNDTLATGATPTTGNTYRLHTLTAPKLGSLVINVDGTFVYTPRAGITGLDYFWYDMLNAAGQVLTRKVTIEITPVVAAAPVLVASDPVLLQGPELVINVKLHQIRLPVEVTPRAQPGELYRITIKQETVDCDGFIFSHVSCYDLVIGKCG